MNNPFVAPPAASMSSAPTVAAANPFDPLAPPPADPFANAPPLQPTPTNMSGGENPFASPSAASAAAMPAYAAPYQQQPQQQLPASQALPQQPSVVDSYETALVPSQYPTNPYGGVVAAPQAAQNYQWGLDAGAAPVSSPYGSGAPVTSGSSYGQPSPYVAPAPMPPTFDNYNQQPPGGPYQQQLLPYQAPYQQPQQTEITYRDPPLPAPEPEPAPRHDADVAPPAPSSSYTARPVDVPLESRELRPANYEYGQRELPTGERRREDEFKNYVNPMREELAREAPPGSSPLPKPELVRKKGYVLSRISFRTIVMKKWKQSFWVQYGPHTMLWFRNESDFTDWLNNPYHDQVTRNFLIKLAVNFVHDLYKPNVRGYQVTQCRSKAYGNKMIRQFKLERWMDYGPTIAAAFGSYDPKEVDELRAAIVECMRNTPLHNGIRATGAVRRDRSQDEEDDDRHDDRRSDDSERVGSGAASPSRLQSVPSADSAPAAEEDLLDVDNWNDVPGQGAPPNTVPYGQPPMPPNPYGAPPHSYAQAPTQGQYPPQAQPPQSLPGSYQPNAMVPFPGPTGGYPGAPPPQQPQPTMPQPYGADPWAAQQQQAPPQQYPPPPQQGYGAPPAQYHTPAY